MKVPLLLLCTIYCLHIQAQNQKKLLSQLNSPARETNLSISPNGKFFYFMSEQGGQPWSTLRKDKKDPKAKRYDGDIWYSMNVNGEWQPPVCMDNSVNTSDGEDEPNITADGQRVYFQSFRDNWENTGGPYYMASLNGVIWQNPVGMGGEINRFFKDLETRMRMDMVKRLKEKNLYPYYLKLQAEDIEEWQDSLQKKGFFMPDFSLATDGMSVSPNENIFIVSAYIPEKGNYDLMISRRNEEGAWSYPRSLEINSDKEEKSVFIAADNETVYFASDRPGGQGKLDIYKTTLRSGTSCSAPVNLGSTVNTPKDDNSLILDATGKAGFMTSDGDIYQAVLQLDAPKAIVINGIVIDQNNNPLPAAVELFQGSIKTPAGKSTSNLLTGAYSFSMKREEGQFRQVVHTTSGQTVDTLFEVKANTPDVLNFVLIVNMPPQEYPAILDSLKAAPTPGRTFDFQFHFDADSSVIKKVNYPLLNEIAKIIRANTDVVFEIGGHTNGRIEQGASQKLSTDRALAVFNYLLQQKVPMKNMRYKGYGKTKPVASDDTKYGRQLNQRVEIKIVKLE